VTQSVDPTSPGPAPGEAEDGPVIRDRRRIDPLTGQVRTPGGATAEGAATVQAEDTVASVADDTAELVVEADAVERDLASLSGDADNYRADLQRVQAEYANYRKRVERDREAVRDGAVGSVLAELLPVLDDIGRAEQHGELVGGFRVVADQLAAAVARLGLEPFGAVGDPFDPALHEALAHVPAPEGAEPGEPVCAEVYQPGYRHAGRVLRPARVVVADTGG
jgi:molecular chaperone GrpE